jgi:hypothetical protein
MPIPSYASWKQRTNRGLLTPRSDELGAVDVALENYDRTQTPATFQQLKKALDDWIRLKGPAWRKTSTRNADLVVQELYDALHPKATASALPAQGWNASAATTGWNTVTVVSGRTPQLYRQAFPNECGPSCVATVGRLLGHQLDITRCRTKVGTIDHNRPPGMAHGLHDWKTDWSYMTSLTQALSQDGVRMAHTRKNLDASIYKSFCEGRSLANPAILRVAWADGTGHFVVTIGKNGKSGQTFVEILDPCYGYQRVDLARFPDYKPGGGIADGTLDRHWSIETT